MKTTLAFAAFMLAAAIVTFIHNTPVRLICGLTTIAAVLYAAIVAGHVDRASTGDLDE